MDIVLGLSYGIGLLLIGIAATVYWGNGSKSIALWVCVAGVLWIVLTGGIQSQQYIWEADKHDPARREQIETQRANLVLLNFYTVHIQSPPTPIVGWAFQAMFKNAGPTVAKNVRIAYGHIYFLNEKKPSEDDLRIPPHSGPIVDIGPNVEFRSEMANIGMNLLEGVQKGEGTLMFFGEVIYDDIFVGTEQHKLEFCVTTRIGRDPHRSYPGGMGEGPFIFQACPTRNSSR